MGTEKFYMNNRMNYETIKDAVGHGYDEYMHEENLNICQATVKILEEDWREVNCSAFAKASYFLNIAITCIEKGEIADFIFERLDDVIIESFQNIDERDRLLYEHDFKEYNKLRATQKYHVIETSFSAKSRVDYLLNL